MSQPSAGTIYRTFCVIIIVAATILNITYRNSEISQLRRAAIKQNAASEQLLAADAKLKAADKELQEATTELMFQCNRLREANHLLRRASPK